MRKTASALIVILLLVGRACAEAPPADPSKGAATKPAIPATAGCRLKFYGTYSLGTRDGVSLPDRVAQLRDLGGNFVVALGKSRRDLDALPPGMLGAPGCSLMKPNHWKDATGKWSASAAHGRLQALADEFDNHPRVWGVCLSHEVNEFADHGRRVWMYRQAKRVFHNKKVFFYYARAPEDYGLHGQVEGDVFFFALPPFTRTGEYDLSALVEKLERGLAVIDRTPDIPLWAQTSINADQSYVTGPDTMILTWGPDGERMIEHARAIFSRTSPAGTGVTGFFWRSLGRFEWDLGYPPFTAERARVLEIAQQWKCP
jgi:hypothetical protein